MTDVDELERAARLAIAQRPHDRDWWRGVAIAIPSEAELEYMAAADPSTVLRLIARAKRSRTAHEDKPE